MGIAPTIDLRVVSQAADQLGDTPKWIKNALEMDPKWAPNWTQNRHQNGSKMEIKMIQK